MKKNTKENLFIVLTLLFIILLFKNNLLFKNCIITGCNLFFKNVFPSLFPMFIINDILINCNFINILEILNNKIFKKIFKMPSPAFYIFILSTFSGTPTNAYIIKSMVEEKKISPKDAGIILSYSCFLNPLFLYNILTAICNNEIAIKLILINYGLNIIIALFFRKYPYQKESITKKQEPKPFAIILTNSINRAMNTLLNILGTIIFYLLLCEAISLFIKNPILNCIINGLLEATGGLYKLSTLQINLFLKGFFASIFISFLGFSIHTQIKNIISDVKIPTRYFFFTRILHAILSAICWQTISTYYW